MCIALTRRTQILLDDERYERLQRHADESGVSIATLIRRAIDRTYPAVPPDRARAGKRLLGAAPMPVEDWPEMKREMLDRLRVPAPARRSE